jgi:hypothetical protein
MRYLVCKTQCRIALTLWGAFVSFDLFGDLSGHGQARTARSD